MSTLKSGMFALAIACVHAFDISVAQEAKPLSHSDLFKKADAVLIVTPSNTEDEAEKIDLKNRGIKGYLQSVKTKCVVSSILKGDRVENITIKHHRAVYEDSVIANGPTLIAFRSEPAIAKIHDRKVVLPTPSYLLYLSKNGDIYSPVTGHYYSRLSVFELVPPVLGDK